MRSTERSTRKKLIGVVVALAFVAAACGSDDAESTSTDAPAETEAPAETDAPADTESATTEAPADTTPADTTPAEVEEPGVPTRVVSLSPTHTEIMFAIGAGDLLVAVDDFSNFPAEALQLPNELSGFEPNVEAIAAYEPDLVLIGGDFSGLGDQLAAIGIASWDGPAATTIDDTYAQIEQLGAATGNVGGAAELVLDMQTRLAAAIAAAPQVDGSLSIYHELDPTFFSSDSTTFIGQIYTLLGLQNIADQAEGDNFGYPQLNAEFIVSANPDLIFLADTKCCDQTADTVGARDGWDVIAAVQNGNVIEMDDDVASRWGPRIVDYIEAVSAAVQAAAVPA
ncbi:ABC transporter substrate-binding protein, partial [Ilumatobacter sp.]|uniref:ABC transporter substrate-binding protein n=1 Tax=Ilumatobacter sp. TaxID=1967498 RepID=UPI003752EAE1